MQRPNYLDLTIRLLSQSPRRLSLLQNAGFHTVQSPTHADESIDDSWSTVMQPEHLALRKLNAYMDILHRNEVLLAADTMVFLDDQSLGKPNSKSEAIDFLSRLSGKTHTVITGVALKYQSRLETLSSETRITFSDISVSEMKYYVNNFEVMDKAGAYGIQDWIGLAKISRLDGDFYGVMGLPIQPIIETLITFCEE